MNKEIMLLGCGIVIGGTLASQTGQQLIRSVLSMSGGAAEGGFLPMGGGGSDNAGKSAEGMDEESNLGQATMKHPRHPQHPEGQEPMPANAGHHHTPDNADRATGTAMNMATSLLDGLRSRNE